MAKNIDHYYRDGTKCTSKVHKMPDGTLHSGATHTKASKPLFHLKELSKTAQKRAAEDKSKKGKKK